VTKRLNPRMPTGWELTGEDTAFAALLRSRLPRRLFDVHMHLYRTCDIDPRPAFLRAGPAAAGLTVWREHIGGQVGRKRLVGALCTPFPSKRGDMNAANRFVLDALKNRKNFRATILVSPASTRADTEAAVAANPRIIGFKPYHLLAAGKDTFQCDLNDFLPEWVWQVADEHGLLILLHMVKDGALADPANRKDIRYLCEKYPNARLVLAHAARGFHAPNTISGIAGLRGLENVWFDTSAVCEAAAIRAILDEFGPRRVMWGTDFPVSQQRGRTVTLGSGFAWITTDQVQWNNVSYFGKPVLVGLESTKAALDAADMMGLNDEDLRDIFCDNALRLLGMQRERDTETQDRYRAAKAGIPGGVQLLSKRPEMFAPGQWPAYFREARGCEVWDLDGRHYYDLSIHGIGASLLGFRDPDVTRAVRRRVNLGSWSTLNPPEEAELAERLCGIHPWAEQARFTRAGGEAMAVAVRIARATTDRSVVAVCGYHGWHDWYLAANLGGEDALRGHLLPGLSPLGVPRELRGTNFTFTYNNREELREIISKQRWNLAAVVMEPCRFFDPEPGFLEFVRDQAHGAGALLIFDEITIGWRLVYGGAHLRFGVNPDIAVFGKTLSNGHLMSAVIGTTAAMSGAHDSFISSSYWTEGVGPAAALATLEKMARIDVPAHCARIGERVKNAWREHGERNHLPIEVDDGYPALAHFSFKHDLADALRTLYVQLMLERGFLAGPAFYVSLAHADQIVDRHIAGIEEVFGEIGESLQRDDVEKQLKGPVAHSGFRRLL